MGQTHYRVEWFLRASGPIVAGVAIAEAGVHLFKQYAVGDCEAAARMIPIIDYGPYFAGAPGALEGVAADVAHACENVGFFYALNHGVSDDTIERAFAASRRFHALPLEQKLALRLDDNNIGYLPIDASIQGASAAHKATRPNQNESFFVAHDRGPDHPDVIAGKPLRGRNRWPPRLPGLRADMMAYFDALRAMCDRMLPHFAMALGIPPITSRRISPTKLTPICVFCTIRRRIPLKTIHSVRRRIPTIAS